MKAHSLAEYGGLCRKKGTHWRAFATAAFRGSMQKVQVTTSLSEGLLYQMTHGSMEGFLPLKIRAEGNSDKDKGKEGEKKGNTMNSLNTKDFDFDLPEELIAQTPIPNRDHARLMTVDRRSGELGHRHFYDLPELLTDKDCLILNDSKVLPARIYGVKEGTGAVVEFLLLRDLGEDRWETLAGPGKRAKTGSRFLFGEGILAGEVTAVLPDGNRILSFSCQGQFLERLSQVGTMPLPPYIKERLADQSRYQTVYAREPGSAAAPTAGLHFTPALLDRIKEKGIPIGFVTLHVGLGTFRPVSEEKLTDHKMHSERYLMPQETAQLINRTHAQGGRVVAVGTTSCRTIESVAQQGLPLSARQGDTEIYIYPGYRFRGIDGLVTNFHLPKSTLMMLVSALAGREAILRAYKEAVAQNYRFFSFGDAMMIL